MDRSFLSHTALINASRNFICIRTATYEDAQEANFLRQVFSGRQGELENTVFALLTPDGQTPLSRTGRSPQFAFRTPEEMAAAMEQLAQRFPGKAKTPVNALPVMKDVRLAVNVAACDGLPLLIVYGKNKQQLEKLEQALLPLAFSAELAGKFSYVMTTNPQDLTAIGRYDPKNYGYLAVDPNAYGTGGQVKYQWSAAVKPDQLASALATIANGTSKTNKNHQQHVRNGMRQGISWETEIPVEDKMSLRAMQQRRQRKQR